MNIYVSKVMMKLMLFVFGKKYILTYPSCPGVYTGKNICYDVRKKQKLDVYYPDQGKGLPVVLYIHGGGWASGCKDLLEGYGKLLASKDYICVTINYRLAPKYKFPKAIYDVSSAYRWIQDNISDFGGDPGKIYLAGDSAGANLAMTFTCACVNPYYAKFYPKLAIESAMIKGLMLWYGVFDLESAVDSGFPNVKEICQSYLGSLDVSHDKFNLSKFITPNLPPVFITSSAKDQLHKTQSEYFAKKLEQKGIVLKRCFFDASNEKAIHGYIINYALECTRAAFQAQIEFLDELKKASNE